MNDEITEKINKVKNGDAESEIFHKLRPPEEFGDSVELYFDKDTKMFRAVVFDPEMGDIYAEEKFKATDEVHRFIVKTVT